MKTSTTSPPLLSTEAINAQKTLAKLLSEEDIQVTIGNYSTAFFNTETRVLGLPSWSLAEEQLTPAKAKYVIDLLTGHEVGHARHTPADGIAKFKTRFADKKVPFSVCNIIEDIRIERLILDDYPGLLYGFKQGYQYFIESDKFEIADKDTSKMNFIDRLNIRAKTRNSTLAPLSDIEEAFYQKCLKAESFDDVLDLVEEAIKMIADEKSNSDSNDNNEGQSEEQPDCEQGDNDDPSAGDWSSNDDSTNDSTDDTDGAGEQAAEENGDDEKAKDPADEFSSFSNKGEELLDGDKTPGNDSDPDISGSNMEKSLFEEELESHTQEALERNINEMNDSDAGSYINTPSDKHLLSTIISLDEILKSREEGWRGDNFRKLLIDSSEDWNDFKQESKKHVSILAKEFERRKAAYQYSRATTSRTGVIDIEKLHSYKYDDQIFKSVTAMADAKSHGMIFFIDYSGSMTGMLASVIEQTIQLVFFCKQVGIPFDVYGFTSPSYKKGDAVGLDQNLTGLHVNMEMTQLRHLVSSSLKKKEFENVCKQLWVSTRYESGGQYDSMGSTPLNETLLVAHPIINNFQKKHRVQKTNVIILSDGEGHKLYQTCSRKALGASNTYSNDVNRHDQPKTNNKMVWKGKVIDTANGFHPVYKALIHSLKTNLNVNIIGFFLSNSSNLKRREKEDLVRKISTSRQVDNTGHYRVEPRKYMPYQSEAGTIVDKAVAESKKLKTNFLTIPNYYGYDQYFILLGKRSIQISSDEDENILEIEDTADLNSAAARNKIARQFTKIAGSSRKTRIFLNTFAETIA